VENKSNQWAVGALVLLYYLLESPTGIRRHGGGLKIIMVLTTEKYPSPLLCGNDVNFAARSHFASDSVKRAAAEGRRCILVVHEQKKEKK